MVIGMWSAIIIGVSLIIGVGSRYILKKNDNPVEQIAEQIFENQTGIEVDFSPEEKKELEKKFKVKVDKVYKA